MSPGGQQMSHASVAATTFHTAESVNTPTVPPEVQQRLSLELIGVVEAAAAAAARTMGRGDAKGADRAAVEAMRAAFEAVPISGTVVIGEGERDEAPMLYIGERVGAAAHPEIDIAVDPLEGTNLCATGASNSIAVLAASERGGLLNAPDCYMEKIIAGPACRGALDLDAPVTDNLQAIARCLDREVTDLVVVILDRPRHQRLIEQVRAAGARIRLIQDGDLSAGITAAVRGAGVHAVLGTGGAPEGVLTAAAIRCLHGEMVGRLVVDTPALKERVQAMGISDPHRVYRAEELAPGRYIVFAACGVTTGALLTGVRFFGGGYRTHSIVMTLNPNEVRFVDSIHIASDPGPRGVQLY
jgi:fructose-1,6-bisphosphatase class II